MKRVGVIASFVFCLFAGCSAGGPETVPVYGALRFEGREPPKVCRLFFKPVESAQPSRPSIAEVQPDGTYFVKAFRDSDGLLPGTYKVSVSYFDLKPGANPGLDSSWIERRHEPDQLVVDQGSSGVEFNITVPRQS